MTAEDERDRLRHEAERQALLVEGVAMAFRAKADAVLRYAADYRAATWLEPGAAPTAPPEPTFSLLTDPYFAAIAQAAVQPAPKPGPTAPEAPVPVYRVRRTTDGR